MLVPEQVEVVLISAKPALSDCDRLVSAFYDGNHLFVPIDRSRGSNRALLDASTLYIRHIDDAMVVDTFTVHGHHAIDAADRERLERHASTPLSETTEVLHLVGVGRVDQRFNDQVNPGFVAIIDGSERGLRALGPAAMLGDWYGRQVMVCAVTAGPDDRDSRSAVLLQIESTSIEPADVTFVSKDELESHLFLLMRQGHIAVAATYGVWSPDGRLRGMLNGLVRHNAPAIVGIGPNVDDLWSPDDGGPIIVCVDDSQHAHHVVDRIEAFLVPARNRVIVAHVAAEDAPDVHIANDVASEINQRFGRPVESRTITGEQVVVELVSLALHESASLVITHSWHRAEPHEPNVQSTSLSSAAHAPCPVVILSDESPAVPTSNG